MGSSSHKQWNERPHLLLSWQDSLTRSSTYPALAWGSDSHMTDIYFHPVVYLVVSFNLYGPVNRCAGPLANEVLLHKQTTEGPLSKVGGKGWGRGKKVNDTCGIKQLVNVTSQWRWSSPSEARWVVCLACDRNWTENRNWADLTALQFNDQWRQDTSQYLHCLWIMIILSRNTFWSWLIAS